MYLKPFALLSLLVFFSCKKETDTVAIQIETLPLTEAIEQISQPLDLQPLRWEDNQLSFLEEPGQNANIIGLGEATHGTSEFIETRKRIFQYLVNNYGYRTLAIEADFGESLLINQAIQRGDTEQLRQLVQEKMLFTFVYRNEETLALLEWMSDYNKNKPVGEKLNYVGVDCQFNNYHPALLLDFLSVNAPMTFDVSNSTLKQILTIANQKESIPDSDITTISDKLATIAKIYKTERDLIIENSSIADYELYKHLIRVIQQVIEVRHADGLRDGNMAENVLWWFNFYDKKMLFLAHDLHVGNLDENYVSNSYAKNGTTGHLLKTVLGNKYKNIGFSFSGGQFMAREHIDNQVSAPKTLTLFHPLPENTMNEIFHQQEASVFVIDMTQLNRNKAWQSKLQTNATYLSIGAVFYSNRRQVHFNAYQPSFFDLVLHFDETKATTQF